MTTPTPEQALGNIAEVTSGQSAPQDPTAFGDTGRPFIRAGSLEGLLNGQEEEDLEHIPDNMAQKFRMRLFPADTVVFAKSGMSAKIGRVYRLKSPCYVVSHLAAVVPGDSLNPGFLQRWLEKNPPSRLIPNDAYPSIRLSAIAALQLPLPSREEQQRIAAILDKADTIRSRRGEAVRIADDLLRSVFLDMFGDPAATDVRWPTGPLSAHGEITTGNTPSRKQPEYYGDFIEWIKSDNINTPSHVVTRSSEMLSEEGFGVCRSVAAGATLVTCIAGSPSCIGNAAMTDRCVAFNQQINAITPSESTDARFLYVMILLLKRVIQRASTNAMKGMVNKSQFANVRSICPPSRLQKEFGRVAEKQMTIIENYEAGVRNATDLYAALIQRAFRRDL